MALKLRAEPLHARAEIRERGRESSRRRRNILPLAAKQMKRGVELSHEAEREIEATFQAARSNVGAAASVFMIGDPPAARAMVEQKREFRRREADAIRAHLAQLRTSNGTGALPLDLWRDIKRLNDHLVAGSAYPVLEASDAAGERDFGRIWPTRYRSTALERR